ncbi:hypothetical protein L1049_005534 [Liquidambar formosana]|uniref:Uncharacterized protein n=1 Tax=Liquidambar formosana TaxID=63359 RepID=A0AAP0REL9_LIQFO
MTRATPSAISWVSRSISGGSIAITSSGFARGAPKGMLFKSDYKAHLKTCGTRGHSCDCGRVFSRVESFIEHQDACTIRRVRPELQALQPACSSRTASSTSPSSDANFSIAPLAGLIMPKPAETIFLCTEKNNPCDTSQQHNLELQLLPSSNMLPVRNSDENHATHLKLSIGSCDGGEMNELNCPNSNASRSSPKEKNNATEPTLGATRLRELASEQMKLAVAEKAYAEEARQQAKRQIEIAEMEFANARRIRQQALAELEKAQILKEQATRKISSTIMQITCHACKQQFQATTAAVAPSDETSFAMSHMSSAVTEGEGEQ